MTKYTLIGRRSGMMKRAKQTGGLICNKTWDSEEKKNHFDKTFKEIYDCLASGYPVVVKEYIEDAEDPGKNYVSVDIYDITSAQKEDNGTYTIDIGKDSVSGGPDDYPVY